MQRRTDREPDRCDYPKPGSEVRRTLSHPQVSSCSGASPQRGLRVLLLSWMAPANEKEFAGDDDAEAGSLALWLVAPIQARRCKTCDTRVSRALTCPHVPGPTDQCPAELSRRFITSPGMPRCEKHIEESPMARVVSACVDYTIQPHGVEAYSPPHNTPDPNHPCLCC